MRGRPGSRWGIGREGSYTDWSVYTLSVYSHALNRYTAVNTYLSALHPGLFAVAALMSKQSPRLSSTGETESFILRGGWRSRNRRDTSSVSSRAAMCRI